MDLNTVGIKSYVSMFFFKIIIKKALLVVVIEICKEGKDIGS